MADICVILCPGPSLTRYVPDHGPSDLIIAVNRAATASRCDCWACSDHPLQQDIQAAVLGSPVLLTRELSAESIARKVPWRGEVVMVESLGEQSERLALRWDQYSATAALAFAAKYGAKDITTYGCDWTGSDDWDKGFVALNRTETRWTDERGIWAATVAYFGLRITKA